MLTCPCSDSRTRETTAFVFQSSVVNETATARQETAQGREYIAYASDYIVEDIWVLGGKVTTADGIRSEQGRMHLLGTGSGRRDEARCVVMGKARPALPTTAAS